MILFKGLNRLLGFIAGIALYPAKSIIVNLLTLAAAAVLVTLLALPILIGLPIYLGIEVGKSISRGWGIAAGILSFLALPFVAVVAIPVAALVHVGFSVYDVLRTFFNGIIEGLRFGLFSHVLSHALINIREFSTTLTSLFGPAKESNYSERMTYSPLTSRPGNYSYGSTDSANQSTYSSMNDYSLSTSPTSSSSFDSSRRVPLKTSSYTHSISLLSQAETENQNSGLLNKAELSKAGSLKGDKDVEAYSYLHYRLTTLDDAKKRCGTPNNQPLFDNKDQLLRCEVTREPITNPGLLVQSYRDDNSRTISIPNNTKIVDQGAYYSQKASLSLPDGVDINGEYKQVSHEVHSYLGLNNTAELQVMAEVVRKKLPMDDVIAELKNKMSSALEGGTEQFTNLFRSFAQAESTDPIVSSSTTYQG